MPLLKITRPGLLAIACSVVLLWTCLLAQWALMRRANADRAAVIRDIQMRQRKSRTEKVERPPIRGRHVPRAIVG